MVIWCTTLHAQPRPDANPNGGSVSNTGSNTIGSSSNGGSAPIGGGLAILLAMGALYAGNKYLKNSKEENKDA